MITDHIISVNSFNTEFLLV